MNDRIRFVLNRFGERLWVKPLAMAIVSVIAAWLATLADRIGLDEHVPKITVGTVESLLTIISSSMLVIATFAVGSMVSSYASASNTATPRSFSLVVADDMSQNALSVYLGAFIFSIVALMALKTGWYGTAGKFALLALTLLVFVSVVLTFVYWVDRIARLGRLGTTVKKVESATASAMRQACRARDLTAAITAPKSATGVELFSDRIGYVQRVDVEMLQDCAEKNDLFVTVNALPGTFIGPERPLARVVTKDPDDETIDSEAVLAAFVIGDERTFDADPRFGLVVLAEIASRALSPAVNDSGTAISVIATLVRLFATWSERAQGADEPEERYDRVALPPVDVAEMFDDAFTPIARDGAGMVEVATSLQAALASLSRSADPAMRSAANRHAALALTRAQYAMKLAQDYQAVKAASDAARSAHSTGPRIGSTGPAGSRTPRQHAHTG